jgi:hypothetical protein
MAGLRVVNWYHRTDGVVGVIFRTSHKARSYEGSVE